MSPPFIDDKHEIGLIMKQPDFRQIPFDTFAIVALFILCTQAMAHGTAGSRLENVNHALEHRPGDAGLFLKRGRIYQEEKLWDKAMADYKQARQLDKNLHEVDYWTGMLYFEQRDYAVAERYLREYIKLSDSPLGQSALGDLYAQTGSFRMSAIHYDKAIKLDANPPPGLYLKRARVLMKAHAPPIPPELLNSIVTGIDRGIARHGELVAYLQLLIELYENNGDYRRALDTFARLPENIQAAPTWQLTRADLLLKAGDKNAAALGYAAAIEAVKRLPEHRRNVNANMEVKQRAVLALNLLEHARESE